MYLENLIDRVCAENSNVSRKKITVFVEEKLGLADCSIEERDEIESNCAQYHDYVMAEAEKYFDSMRQADEELENRQILMAEFHPSNLNK